MKTTSKTLKFTFSYNKPCNEQHPWEKGQINFHLPAWNYMSRGAKYKKQQDIVSLCSPRIQQCERQMCFYWADYPQAHCPAVRDACAWAPLVTVAVRWVMFLRFSDFFAFFLVLHILYPAPVVSSGEFDSKSPIPPIHSAPFNLFLLEKREKKTCKI